MRGLSLRVKVFFLFAGAALMIVVPALLLIAQAVERKVYEDATRDLAKADSALQNAWELRDENLTNGAKLRAYEREVIETWSPRRPGQLKQRLQDGDEKLVVMAIDTTYRVWLGTRVDSAQLAAAAGAPGTSIVLPDSGPPLRVAFAAVSDNVDAAAGDTLAPDSIVRLGFVGIGREVDALGLRKESASNAEVAWMVRDSLIGTTLSDTMLAALRAMNLDAVRTLTQGRPQRVQVGGKEYYTRAKDLATHGPRVSVFFFRPVAEERELSRGIRSSLVGIGIGFVVLALLLAAVVARIVAGPAQVLAEAAKRLARGDYDAPLPRDSGDEIGQLSRTFGEMRRTLAEREARLRSAQAEMIHREKLAAMGRLVAQLSHEINNPIYNIQNLLEALERRGDPGDPNREFLELAQEELARMATLTRQLLDQSRPLSDAALPVSLNTLVHRVLTLAGSELQARGIRAETDLAADLPRVVAHPEGVQQVLANLVNNALDAMPGGGTLRLSTRADADAVEVVVEDTGTGIAEADLPHIFEAFYTTKPGVAGIGLGLFVSEGIIRGHRGRISVESRPGEGSRFTVRLPRETLDEAAAPGEPRPDEEAAAAAA